MITLELPPQQQAIVEQQSKQVGMSIEDYIISRLPQPKKECSNTMIKRVLAMPKPTSYDSDQVVTIQRELRNEWS